MTRTEWTTDLDERELTLVADLYRVAFTELNRRTVQRHLLTAAELADLFADKRVRKYIARNDDGQIEGLSVQTNDLGAWPLISPEYFEAHYPDLYRRKAIWYIGFVCARPTAQHSVFPALISAMMEPIRESKGMGVLDFSSEVILSKRLDRRSRQIIERIAPLRSARDLGSQHHVGYEFDWPIA